MTLWQDGRPQGRGVCRTGSPAGQGAAVGCMSLCEALPDKGLVPPALVGCCLGIVRRAGRWHAGLRVGTRFSGLSWQRSASRPEASSLLYEILAMMWCIKLAQLQPVTEPHNDCTRACQMFQTPLNTCRTPCRCQHHLWLLGRGCRSVPIPCRLPVARGGQDAGSRAPPAC